MAKFQDFESFTDEQIDAVVIQIAVYLRGPRYFGMKWSWEKLEAHDEEVRKIISSWPKSFLKQVTERVFSSAVEGNQFWLKPVEAIVTTTPFPCLIDNSVII